jgi:hypothetical protein
MKTIFHVSVRPRRNRDRRRQDVTDRANQLVFSLKSYLMAHDMSAPNSLAASPDQSPSLMSWLTGNTPQR